MISSKHSLCFDCKGHASPSKSSVHDTTSVSFRQLSVELDKWVWPRRIVIFTATSDLQNPVCIDTVVSWQKCEGMFAVNINSKLRK